VRADLDGYLPMKTARLRPNPTQNPWKMQTSTSVSGTRLVPAPENREFRLGAGRSVSLAKTGGESMTTDEWERRQQLELADRLREIREDVYGEYGGQVLADALKIPPQTWLGYESGVVVPVKIVLQLMVMARVDHHWLLTGQGQKYVDRSEQYAAGHRES
jgi:hypothetical protein